MDEPPESAERLQELELLRDLAARSKPLPRGTKPTVESRFYSLARKWVPRLLDERKKT